MVIIQHSYHHISYLPLPLYLLLSSLHVAMCSTCSAYLTFISYMLHCEHVFSCIVYLSITYSISFPIIYVCVLTFIYPGVCPYLQILYPYLLVYGLTFISPCVLCITKPIHIILDCLTCISPGVLPAQTPCC